MIFVLVPVPAGMCTCLCVLPTDQPSSQSHGSLIISNPWLGYISVPLDMVRRLAKDHEYLTPFIVIAAVGILGWIVWKKYS